MPDIDPEIARIAALRGKPVNYYTERMDHTKPIDRVPVEQIGRLFSGNPDWRMDFRAFDRLPARSREFVRSCPLQLNAAVYDSLLMLSDDDEEGLISRVLAHMPGRIVDWVRKHYGSGHPALKRAI